MNIPERLEKSRQELLDLSMRNRLLSCPKDSRSGLDIVEECSDDIYRTLVTDSRTVGFRPSPQTSDDNAQTSSAQRSAPATQTSRRPVESGPKGPAVRLQTELPDAQLEKRLLRLYRRQRTLIQEQGINTLYLALGFLHWRESESERYWRRAPLVLVPVALNRTGIRSKFRIKFSEEDLGPNLSLEEKLRRDFDIALPDFPETLSPDKYFCQVESAIRSLRHSHLEHGERTQPWRVKPKEISLGFFSFAKLRMYRDLDPDQWPSGQAPGDHPILGALLGDSGFGGVNLTPETLPTVASSPDSEPSTILDADSSQVECLRAARTAKAMVVQGPPGTGKSQTIANMIADAIHRGETVLFVAEKMAALEVVERRLLKADLGNACLQLHSRGANKKAVLDDLDKTMQQDKPVEDPGVEHNLRSLKTSQQELTQYAEDIAAPIGDSDIPPRIAIARHCGATASLPTPYPSISLDGADRWTHDDVQKRERAAEVFDEIIQEIGDPRHNLFHGSLREEFLPSDEQTLHSTLNDLDVTVQQIANLASPLAASINAGPVPNLAAARSLHAVTTAIEKAPSLDGCNPDERVWSERASDLMRLLDIGRKLQTLRSSQRDRLTPRGLARDVAQLREDLATTGASLLRFLNSKWRAAHAEFLSLCAGKPPRRLPEILHLLDTVVEAGSYESDLDENRHLYVDAFESAPDWTSVDWTLRHRQAEWIYATRQRMSHQELPEWTLAAAARRSADLPARLREMTSALDRFDATLGQLLQFLKHPPAGPLFDFVTGATSFDQNRTRIARLRDSPGQLRSLSRHNAQSSRLRSLGLGPLVEHCEEHSQISLAAAFRATHADSLLRRAFADRPSLRTFDRLQHERTVRLFCEHDRARFRIHQHATVAAHHQAMPPQDAGGRIALLRRYLAKKRGLPSIRRLMEEVGPVIQRIKPVFLMSPLSVAQFLPPGSVEFDVVIFDEASQVRAVDGFGTILRGERTIVVGDSKQLPPTDFFMSVVRELEDDRIEETQTGDIESLLKLMAVKGAQSNMLRWHYRSQHESLVEFSNRTFYDSRLNIFPSPIQDREQLGLAYSHHPTTEYLRGRRAHNPAEAKIVAEAVMAHAQDQMRLPVSKQKSLLVVTFSVAQRDAVADALEQERRTDDSCAEFFDNPEEPFEVKNLESVQGDERDVIFISVGYGRDGNGRLYMNFGPINTDGGERRLNVLCTRARQNCRVFSNIQADDLHTTASSPLGLKVFKDFLHYAQHGTPSIVEPGTGETESEFEDEVRRSLEKHGYQVDAQVGTAGYRIDLAVQDPGRPGRYLIGIECDGAQYHSAKSARDRDRLRAEILQDRGWRLHRIWSTAWFRDSDGETLRAVEAIKDAARGAASDSDQKLQHSPAQKIRRIPSKPATLCAAPEYHRVSIKIDTTELDAHEVPVEDIVKATKEIIRHEGPIHTEILRWRLRDALGAKRKGPRINDVLSSALESAKRDAAVERSGDFWEMKDASRTGIRSRAALPRAERWVGYVAPTEIDRGVQQVLRDTLGARREEMPSLVAARLGLVKTRVELKDAVLERVDDGKKTGWIRERHGFLEFSEPGA